MTSRQILQMCCLIVLVVVAACKNNSLRRVPVQGNVTCDGAPVKSGMISFRPAPGSKGPAAGTAIVDGEFAISTEKGPTVGPHEVEIKIAIFAEEPSKPNEPALGLRGKLQFKSFLQHADISTERNELHFSLTSEMTPGRH